MRQYQQPSVIALVVLNLSLILLLVGAQTAFFLYQRRREARGGARVKMRQSIRFSYMLVGAQVARAQARILLLSPL